MLDKKSISVLNYLYRQGRAPLDPNGRNLFMYLTNDIMDALLEGNYIKPVGDRDLYEITVVGRGFIEQRKWEREVIASIRGSLALIAVALLILCVPSIVAVISLFF